MITASTYNQNNYPSMAHVNSPASWCANSADANPYLLIDLGSPKKVTGFGVQGDSNGDNWAKQTKISYGNEQCCLTEMSKVRQKYMSFSYEFKFESFRWFLFSFNKRFSCLLLSCINSFVCHLKQ